MPPSRRSLFPPFAGVALADILANSVAIVIIMIVVMLMTRYEQEQNKLEQTEDVAVVLSRELATSFVMNALPTSPPAQLHDYVTSPLDRNPQHATMPIIELHDEYLRDYYTGAIYQRDDLLRNDNALDRYLASLSPEQLAAMRVDIYGVGQFYVAMSIFRAHGHQPRHWHFLADGTGRQRPAAHRLLAAGDRVPTAPPDRGEELVSPGNAAGASTSAALPADVSLALAAGGFDAYQADGVSAAQGAAGPSEYFDLPGGVAGEPGAPARTRATQGAAEGGAGADAPTSSRFRAATRTGRAMAIEDPRAFDMMLVLRGLFAFMREEQAAAEANLPSRLPNYDFQRDVLDLAARLPPADATETQMLQSLAFLMETPRTPNDSALTLAEESAGPAEATGPWTVRGQALAMFANEPLNRVVWLRDVHQPPRASVADLAAVTLHLGTHAEIHSGLRVPLGRDGVLLMPTPENPDPSPRWRVVTLVSAARDDFVTGFLYAGLDQVGRVVLPVDENAVAIGGLRTESYFPSVPFREEYRQLLFYGALAALFVGGVVARYWRRA